MNQPLILSLFVLFACSQGLLAQPDNIIPKGRKAAGIGISDLQMMEKMMYVVPGVGSKSKDLLLKQDIKPYMMPIRDLGFRGNELCYAVATCLEYYVNLGRNYKVNLSPDFISLNLSNSGKRGTAQDALEYLVKEGTVSAAILPFDADQLTTAVYNTQRYSINNYFHMFRELTKARQKVFETRKALMRGNPVLIELQAGEALRSYSGQGDWEPSATNKESIQLFPLVVVGYDENQQAFEVRSVWGSKWGRNGYVWISYNDFGKYAQNAYLMIPEDQY